MSRVLIIEASYGDIGTAIDRVLEQFPLDVDGRSVLVKPNILGPFPPERHVNTAPAVVEAVVKRLRASGGEVTVADNPGARGYGAVEKSARVSGILDASLGSYANIATDVETVTLEGCGLSAGVSRRVLEADVLVSLPKFKTHVLTSISGAIKNSFGFVVGAEKNRLHRDLPSPSDFGRMLVDVYKLRVPDLVIMDGVVGMQGNGPSGKSLYPVGKILASDNGVALDAVMAHMMGLKPDKNLALVRAQSEGLGEIDLSRIDIAGDASPLKGFKKPTRMMPDVMSKPLLRAFYPDLDKPGFEVDPEVCTACGNCRDVCPGGAITIEGKVPRYDYSKCIACYCCMELCSEQAIELKDAWRTRIYRRLGLLSP